MDIPVFKLEGIIKTKNEISDFEGPLTLILQLLSKNKIEIRDISISLILDQYLEYLDSMTELNLDIASDFVAMASYLTYIKTKMLLSGDEEISEIEQLISSLEELQRGDAYLQIKAIAQTFSEMYTQGGGMIVGPPEYLPKEEYSYVHVGEDLVEAILRLISRENTLVGYLNPNEVSYPQRVIYSIPEKISELMERLRSIGTIPILELFYESGSKTELIATLVAVLELCRVGSIILMGSEDSITVTYAGAGREPISSGVIEESYN